jgi:DNA-binding LytR/AlgR family response regulator
MIAVILVDDEMASLEELADRLNQLGEVYIAGKYQDPLEALERIREYRPDAVFLDIEMRELDGFTLAGEIIRVMKETAIVFATAYDEYAVKAFEMNAVDYVSKPFAKERLATTLKKIAARRVGLAPQTAGNLDSFIQEQKMKQNVKKVPVWRDNRLFLLYPHEILFFTVKEGEVDVVTGEGHFYSPDSLNYWEVRMKDQRFFRTHQSFLVNLDMVKETVPLFNYTCLLRLEGSMDEVPVSRNYLEGFKQMMLL